MRSPDEVRAITWPFDIGPPAYPLDVSSSEQALRLAAVFSAVRLLAESVACLPAHVYRDLGDARQRVRTSSLIDQPAAYGTWYDWVYQCMTALLLHGNAYGLIVARDGFGFPTTIEWMKTEGVNVREDPENPFRARWFYNGRELNPEDLFHIRAFSQSGRQLGLSPIEYFASTFGIGLAAQKYGADWFANGGIPPGTFKNNQQRIDQTQADVIARRLNTAITRRQPLVYGSDWDYGAIAVPPEQAQFLGAQKLTATQIAAIYDVPAERVAGEPGGSLTYASQEQNQIQLALTVQKWCTRLEHAFFGLLPERQYVKFNLDAMIRTDTKTRHDIYRLDREIGLRNIDEIRELEDLPPLPDGAGADYAPLAVTIAEAAGGSASAAPMTGQTAGIRSITRKAAE